ncbi:hypothetical protein BV25DRAFT_1801445 [Artomyces pyxidatus]|uniref:Uncharacterized protein n=1 Tax=Artomyces pyxidatus TaxID=48021 RepID=A0ACB8T4Y9_9AGAM|nr:hypothetical protein BV25DRAFT_1801445 [Artomyces pyxidatus]
MGSLSRLPVELLVKTLTLLDLLDLTACELSCRRLHKIVEGSVLLQYLKHLQIAGVSDRCGSLSVDKRLQALRRREEAWSEIDIRATFKVQVPFRPTGIYDLTGGAILLGTRSSIFSRATTGYAYHVLPSVPDSVVPPSYPWLHHDLELNIVDVGLGVDTHDLVAVLTSSVTNPFYSTNDGETEQLDLRLFSFSTGKPHPLAGQHVIPIASRLWAGGGCSVLIEIVGDHLALLLTFNADRTDMLVLVDWKHGHAHTLRESNYASYMHFAFLSEDTLVFPNVPDHTLELCKIVFPTQEFQPILQTVCVLELPALGEYTTVIRVDCRAEPNPIGCSPAPTRNISRPFHDSPADAIVIFNYLIRDVRRAPLFEELYAFSFTVHRRALLTLTSIPSTVIDYPWEHWGPPVTRWFDFHMFPEALRWITTSAGQRCVARTPGPSSPIIVRDFNPHHIRSGGEEPETLKNGNTRRVITQPSMIDSTVFTQPIISNLPYTETITQERYQYDGLLMDEERIIGLRVCAT